MLDSENVGIKIRLRDAKTDLAVETNIELIYCDRFKNRSPAIGFCRFWVIGHVQRRGCDRNAMNPLPWPFPIEARLDDSDLRPRIPPLFFFGKCLGNGKFQRRRLTNPLCSAEARHHCSLILIDNVETGQNVPNKEPGENATNDRHKGTHFVSLSVRVFEVYFTSQFVKLRCLPVMRS